MDNINQLKGKFTVISRFINVDSDTYINGPVECNSIIEAMSIQQGFLAGTPANLVKYNIKEKDIVKTVNNLMNKKVDRVCNGMEESIITYTPAEE